MTLDDENAAERFLWSLCKGYDGDGWTRWDNNETSRQLQEIRWMLKAHVDSSLYARYCNAECRGWNNFGADCGQQVPVDKKRCHIHR